MLCVLQPGRMTAVISGSGPAAESTIKYATYGVVMQVDGKIVGLMPVHVKDCVHHITGMYSSNQASSPAHRGVVLEMLDMLLGELGGASAIVDISAHGAESTCSDLLLHSGFIKRTSTKERLVFEYGT